MTIILVTTIPYLKSLLKSVEGWWREMNTNDILIIITIIILPVFSNKYNDWLIFKDNTCVTSERNEEDVF